MITQMVRIDDSNTLFILGYDEGTQEMTFRVTMKPEHRQTEKVEIRDGMVFTQLYHFPLAYLLKFKEHAKEDTPI